MRLKHNKKRNTAFVYEALIRELTKSVVKNNKHKQNKIVSIIDGYCASSATLLSMVCHERWMNKNSNILIHQLRGGCWGKYNELEDNFKNSKKAHKKLIKFYKQHSTLSEEDIRTWLKKDIEFTSKKALTLGLIDKII